MEQSKAIAQGSEAPTNKKSKKIKSKRPDEISIDEVVPGPGAEKQKKPVQFGDEDFSIENVSHSIASKLVAIDEEKVSWEEIWGSCCFHTGKEWANIAAGVVALLFCLYFFLFSLQLMGNASKVMAGCGSGVLFGSDVSVKVQLRDEICDRLSA